MRDLNSDAPEFWQTRYQEERTPWDLGIAAPPLLELYQSQSSFLKPGKMAALGSGYGHDAAFFAKKGFTVTGFDYVQEAVIGANQRYGQWLNFIQADIFSLPEVYKNSFDFVLEHTCFCAIQPHQRKEYVEVVKSLLKPNGYFIGLLWAFVDEDGPPYPSTQTEIKGLFEKDFDIQILKIPVNSVQARAGEELVCLFKLKR